jgi:hypothetical protein
MAQIPRMTFDKAFLPIMACLEALWHGARALSRHFRPPVLNAGGWRCRLQQSI